MRTLRRAIVLAVLVLACSSPAHADCGATCNGDSCIFDGITNKPIGAATLSVDGSCNLVVSGIGSSLVDGVIQSGLGSVYMVTTLATPNFSGSPLGTRADIRQVGTAGGQAGREISLTRIINVTGDLVRMDMDCGAIQVEEYSVEVYNDGALVYRQPRSGEFPVLLFPKADMEAMACALLPDDGELYTTVRFGGPVAFTLQTSGGDLGPFTGDCLKLRGFNPVDLPTSQEAIENRFKDTGPVSIVSLYAGALPTSEDAVCPSVPVPVLPTTWGRLKALYR